MVPNGPTDMCSVSMIASRDFPFACLNDGHPWGQINNQPTVASQVTIFIRNFLRCFGWTLPTRSSGPLFIFSYFSPPFSLQQNIWADSSFLEPVLSSVSLKVCKEASHCLNELLNVELKRTKITRADSHYQSCLGVFLHSDDGICFF